MLILRLALLLLAGMLGAAPGAKADGQITGKRVALVVGNGSYRNVDRLPNAANDARLIAQTLKGLGFTLVGGGAQLDLDRTHLAQAVQDFGHALPGAEVGLFYYSGHGLQVQGVNWLVPVDANPTRPQDLDFQMVDADLVLRQMDGAGTRLNLVLLDACRNNPFATRGLRAVQGGLAEMRAPEGTLISYATQPGNVASDGVGSNSPYTTALALTMQQPGLDVFRVFNQVGLQVKRTTGGSQQPWVSNSPIDGDFYFRLPPPPAVPPPAPVMVSAPPSTPPPVAPPPILPPPIAPLPIAPPPIASAPVAPDRPPPSAPAIAPPASPPPAPPGPLATGPRSVPSDAPPPAAPTGLTEQIAEITRAQPCASLSAALVEHTVRVTGLAPSNMDWAAYLTRLQTGPSRGVRMEYAARVDHAGVEMVPAFACEAIEQLGPAVQATRNTPSGRLIALSQRAVSAGERLAVLVRGAAGKAVSLDMLLPGGMVQHVSTRSAASDPGDVRFVVILPAGSPPGPRLLMALVSDTPLRTDARPDLERSASYFDALRTALTGTANLRADMASFDLRPPVAAIAARTPGPPHSPGTPSRCGPMLERAQLGEPMSDADRAYFRASCR